MKAPNILFVMADQMAAPAMSIYGHPLTRLPHIEGLAERGVVFDAAYTNFPLCAPARFAMLAGRLASAIGAFDNAAEFRADVPTLAHYLRRMGYRTCLSGKMHFVGPDQLHGFEERLTTDICPADFGWTATWDEPARIHPWFHTMEFAASGGRVARSTQLDFDEEGIHQTRRWIYDRARDSDQRPFFLLHSFTHPHDPYVTRPEYWERYDHDEIDLPRVAWIAPEDRDPHGRRLYENYDRGEFGRLSDAQIRNARHGYYGSMSFVDDMLGAVLDALGETGQLTDTIVVFTGDHGDMLGERGLWYKMSFHEWSARVPLVISWPGQIAPGRVARNVSLIDLMPTLLGLAADGREPDVAAPLDGNSLTGLLAGDETGWADEAISEYLCEGVPAPYVMLRRGRYKYLHCDGDPPQLFDVAADPDETVDLAGHSDHAEAERELAGAVAARWDFAALSEEIVLSQRRRRLVHRALGNGLRATWDYQPRSDASRQYYRGTGSYRDIEKADLLPTADEPGN